MPEPIEPVVNPTEPVVPPTTPVVPAASTEPVVPAIPATEPATEPAPVIPKPEPTGNAFFDNMQEALYTKGIDSAKYAKVIEETGTITEELRAELVATFGEAQTNIMEQGVANELNTLKASQAAEAQKVYDAIQLPGVPDGKEAFQKISEWCKKNIPEADKSAYNKMLAAGGVEAQLAIKALKEKYMADPAVTAPANLVPGTGVPLTGEPEVISRAIYTEERRKAYLANDEATVLKLDERARHTMDKHPEKWRPLR